MDRTVPDDIVLYDPTGPVSEQQAYQDLLAGIVLQAEKDYHYKNRELYQREIQVFLNDWPFVEYICDHLNWDPGRTKTAVLEGWGVRSGGKG